MNNVAVGCPSQQAFNYENEVTCLI